MASTASREPSDPSIWTRMIASLTAFAEAAEMDTTAFLEARIVQLERRLAALEGGSLAAATEGN